MAGMRFSIPAIFLIYCGCQLDTTPVKQEVLTPAAGMSLPIAGNAGMSAVAGKIAPLPIAGMKSYIAGSGGTGGTGGNVGIAGMIASPTAGISGKGGAGASGMLAAGSGGRLSAGMGGSGGTAGRPVAGSSGPVIVIPLPKKGKHKGSDDGVDN